MAVLLLVGGLLTVGFARDVQQPVIDAPLPPAEAARTMVVPDGFQVTLFAGEPDVMQPIGFCIDDRGRLWVAEAYNYPHHGTKPGDRILIFEDSDNDGRFDKRTVFYDKLNYVTGIEVGFGGAWVVSPPSLYFIPDQDGDDKPDSEPTVLLDGFGNHANSHNLANALAWGPDGWLYGTHGRTNWSLLGKPGTPAERRVRFDGGVYRYHPVHSTWEPYADGTTNPWGIDWNDVGDAFITNCVNPHLFHVVYGAHYEPWRNRESSQYAYQRIPTIADHLHFVGQATVQEGLGSAAEDAAGGGHAHCGTMVYLGDSWPEKYRNTLFTNNIHGRRINNDLLQREGSGYSASHGKDLMRSKDPWFMGVTLRYGPDGSVFVIDWSDTGECHSVKNTRRETGRIYKISYGKPTATAGDLASLDSMSLVDLQLHRNDWYVQHARRLLQERAHMKATFPLSEETKRLEVLFESQTDVPKKLRILWALHTIGRARAEFLLALLQDQNEYLRAWAVRLLCDGGSPSQDVEGALRNLACKEESPYVRLHIASSLQRLKLDDRWRIAEPLLKRGEDADDHNLPLMLWYGIEPLVNEDLYRFAGLAGATRIPLIARHIGRRVASFPDVNLGVDAALNTLGQMNENFQSELLAGVLEGLEGRRTVAIPDGWPAVYAKLQAASSEAVRERALQLALIFDDPLALTNLRQVAVDTKAATEVRIRAIQALEAKKAVDLAPVLLRLIDEPTVRRAALRGLAEYDLSETPQSVLELYKTFDAAARQDAVQTLASRPEWALKLLDGIEAERVPRQDLSAYTARQIYNLGDAKLQSRLLAVWGEVRTTSAEKTKLVADFKRRLTPESLVKADRSAGRALFQKTCASCHKFFDAGGAIGPDITGSQRTNLDYLLQTLVDPSAAVGKDFQMHIIETTAGRVITGLITSETQAAVTIQTVNEKIVVPLVEIEERKISPLSIMPEGMLQNLKIEQVRALLAYLMGPAQVPMPEDKKP